MTHPPHGRGAVPPGLVAIIDDEPLVRSATSSLVRSLGFDCRIFASADAFLREGSGSFDCILSDIQMPGMSGVALAEQIGAQPTAPPIVLMTAYPDGRAQQLLEDERVACLLDKPLDSDLLQAAIEDALAGRRRVGQ